MRLLQSRSDLLVYSSVPLLLIVSYWTFGWTTPLQWLLRIVPWVTLLLTILWFLRHHQQTLGKISLVTKRDYRWLGVLWIYQAAIVMLCLMEIRAGWLWMPPSVRIDALILTPLTPELILNAWNPFITITILAIGCASCTSHTASFTILKLQHTLKLRTHQATWIFFANILRMSFFYALSLAIVCLFGSILQDAGWLHVQPNLAWLLWLTGWLFALQWPAWQRWAWHYIPWYVASIAIVGLIAATLPLWQWITSYWLSSSSIAALPLWHTVTQSIVRASNSALLPIWMGCILVSNAFFLGWMAAPMLRGHPVWQMMLACLLNPLLLLPMGIGLWYAPTIPLISWLTSFQWMWITIIFLVILLAWLHHPHYFTSLQNTLGRKNIPSPSQLPWFWYARMLPAVIALSLLLWNGGWMLIVVPLIILTLVICFCLFPFYIWHIWHDKNS